MLYFRPWLLVKVLEDFCLYNLRISNSEIGGGDEGESISPFDMYVCML